jgi:hypothetical protein
VEELLGLPLDVDDYRHGPVEHEILDEYAV